MLTEPLTGSALSEALIQARGEGELWCGIDPGVTGAFAFLRMTALRPVIEAVVNMPVTRAMKNGKALGKAEIEWPLVIDVLRDFSPQKVIVERQWPRPHDGIVGAFTSGAAYHGILVALTALGLPYETVTPVQWKNSLGLRGHEKKLSRELATRLMPEGRALFARIKDHGPAEAALMILWKVRYEQTPLSRSLGRRSGVRTLEGNAAAR